MGVSKNNGGSNDGNEKKGLAGRRTVRNLF